MDKIEKLLEVKNLLDSISKKMSELKKDLDIVTSCVKRRKLISTEASERVVAGLLEVNNMNEQCKELYSQVELGEELSDDIGEIESKIAQAISDIELEAKLAEYKRFLLLETDDEETRVLLNAKKADMQKILDNYTDDRESELISYKKFTEAILEKNQTKVVSLMFELSKWFENELLAKAFLSKTIRLPENKVCIEDDTATLEKNHSEKDTSFADEVKGQENNNEIDINAEDKEIQHEEKSDSGCSTDKKDGAVEAVEKAADELSAEVKPELPKNVGILEFDFQKDIIEKGLIITKGVFDKPFFLNASSAESKKTGSKIFVNEIKAKNAAENVVSLKCMDKFNSVTPELVSVITQAPIEEVYNSFAYLQNKGYIREYGVDGIGSFYCMSQRCLKALMSKEARAFIRINYVHDSGREVEDFINPVLVRIAFSKLLTRYEEKLDIDAVCVSQMLEREVFASRFLAGTGDKAYVVTGAFFADAVDVDDYVHTVGRYIDEIKNEHFLFAGINRKYARLLAEFFMENTSIDYELEEIFYYSLTEDKYFVYETDEEIEFDKLFEPCDEKSAQQDAASLIDEDGADTEVCATVVDAQVEKTKSVEQSEVNINSEKVAPEKNNFDDIAPKNVNVEENIFDRDVTHKENRIIDKSDVMGNTYQMILDEKTYCATTYLRSMIEDDANISHTYEKLAYAVNAPWMRCSYSSQKIFELYQAEDDVFTKYLMAAASIRNFFMNHVSYDYMLKALHASVKSIPVVSESVALTNAVYSLAMFKENVHKGVDVYAAYRVKDKMAVDKELDALAFTAKSYYDSYVVGQPRNNKHVRRFVTTWKMIFANDGDMASYLGAIIDKEYDMAELAGDYLAQNFISDGCSLEYSNLDTLKLNKFIDAHWDKANSGNQYKSTPLMSDLRNNLINAIEKVLKLMCEWVMLVDATGNLADDDGEKVYNSTKKALLEDLAKAAQDVEAKIQSSDTAEAAGAKVLKETIDELISRIDGTYDESWHKYYYIDFLRGNDVLLDDEYLPDMRGKFADFAELSLSNRILKHSKAELVSFEEKLDDIFNNYGDDYGTAELIIRYLEDTRGISYEDKYNIKKSEEQAEKDAKLKLDAFIENLELAQSYGQIEETRENRKEKIQKIANEWFGYAKESKNYGFFNMVLERYREKIHEDAKVRGEALLKELAKLKEQGANGAAFDERIGKIQDMIDAQNYTVAEDLMSRINSDEPEEDIEVFSTDYLQKFIDEYDYNYKSVAYSNKKLSDLVKNLRIRNKDDKGAKRLIDNWMSNGQSLGESKLKNLLEALGFAGAEVKEQPKIGKVENYSVLVKAVEGRRVNYRHPIAAFGSKAAEQGFRVVCLLGKYDSDRLLEEFKNISGNKNTLVLLDYALPLSDRRRLARKIKSELGDKIFAVLDRVLIMFLANNYSEQFINQILMYTMMPFAYCQPYVWSSNDTVPPEIFMGRKDELEKIESPSGVNIVYGGRQLGKSALLKKAKMDIDSDENDDRAVLIDIKGCDYKSAARKIGHELFDAGILTDDIDTTDWDDLSRAIRRRLQNDAPSHIPYLLLLLDEADVFIESCAQKEVNFQPFDALKDIQSVGMDRFKFVIAGLHNIVRFKRDAALSNNSVLTHLTSITIKPFGKREARQLLEVPLNYLGLRFPDDKNHQSLISLILAETNYFPGLIQLYCAKLIEAMRKDDYAGYNQIDTPVYTVNPTHIRKVLSDPGFRKEIREKFEITLKLGDDNMYYIIALLMAYLYHQNTNSASEIEGFSANDIIDAAKEYSVKKIASQTEIFISGLMQELVELNILRQTVNDMYLFSRYSFFQLMGTSTEVENKLVQYMED